HWCHVMAHESFESAEIAQLMNDRFVCVKVDREERPDVDALYMQATLALTGQGGWPMTVFLTPDGRPYYAGTYFPPESRHGLPGFPDVGRHMADAYRSRRDDVGHAAAEVGRRLEMAAERTGAEAPLERRIVDDAVTGLAMTFDPVNGGFGGAPKFPPHLALEFLLPRLLARPGAAHAAPMGALTLPPTAEGGTHHQ